MGQNQKLLSIALIIAILAGMVNFVYVFAENEGQAESGSQASTGGFEISVNESKDFDENADIEDFDNLGEKPTEAPTENTSKDFSTEDIQPSAVPSPKVSEVTEQDETLITNNIQESNQNEQGSALVLNSVAQYSVVSGLNHSLRISDGKVQAYGDNTCGQLGTGNNEPTNDFVDVTAAWGDKTVAQVETRGNTSYALTSDGYLYAWGDNSKGQFGNGTNVSSNLPVLAAVGMEGSIKKVSAGLEHAVIENSENGTKIYAFGDNSYGQLGFGTNSSNSLVPILVTDFSELSEAGDYQTYYSGTDSEIIGCGKNDKGQLGSSVDAEGNMICFTKISAGKDHVVGIGINGKMYVWGDNSLGQLGVNLQSGGTYSQYPINTGTDVTDVEAGNNMTLYISNGKVYLGGTNDIGVQMWSKEINLPADCASIALGSNSYAYQSDGTFWHWGYMSEYKVGTGDSVNPIMSEYKYDIVDIDSYRAQTLAIDTAGNIVAWGEGYYPDETGSMSKVSYPFNIDEKCEIKNAVSVSRGKNHNLVLDENGDVWCWGSNSNYPMGSLDGKVKIIKKLPGISDVKQIKGGTEFSLFIKNDGTLWGVGKNDKGQLGISPEELNNTDIPIQITDKADFKYVTACENSVIAIADDGVYSWGGNSKGQLGDGTFSDNPSPKKLNISLEDGEYIKDVKTGPQHCIALTSMGNVYAWGNNGVGQLGIGNKDNKSTAVKVNLSDVKYVNAGFYQSYAIKSDGTVWGWGSGANHQLGTVSVGTCRVPTQITSLNGLNIEKIVGSDGFTIAVDKYGRMYSFGSNAVGGLGVYSQTPEIVAEDYYAEDLRELNKYMKDIPQNLTENIQLPVMMQNGMQVSWTSSNAYYLSEQGIVRRPNSYAKDEAVTLTALVSCGEKTRKLNYDFCVLKKEEGQPGDKTLKTQTLNIQKGKKYIINITAKNVTQISGTEFEFEYDGSRFEMVDAISRSKTFETLSGAVYGDIKITYAGPGIIKFETTKQIPAGRQFTGFVNGIVLKAKETCETVCSLLY